MKAYYLDSNGNVQGVGGPKLQCSCGIRDGDWIGAKLDRTATVRYTDDIGVCCTKCK